jgi:dTDP-glucose pyrophosphorylase
MNSKNGLNNGVWSQPFLYEIFTYTTFRNGWISKEELADLSKSLAKTNYGQYLLKISGE